MPGSNTSLRGVFSCLALAACSPAGPPPDGPAPPGFVAEAEPEDIPGVCNFSHGAYSADKDPKGLNVRAGPSVDAKIVGVLPPPSYEPDFERVMSVSFEVLEAKDGWFRIADARRPSDGSDDPITLPAGWIHGSAIGFDLQTDLAFAKPNPRSEVVAEHWSDDEGGHPFGYRHPLDCKGQWVKLLVTPRNGPEREGWARGVCGNQETSCDGANGSDYRPTAE